MWRRSPKFKELAKHVLDLKRSRAPATIASAEHYLKRLTEHFGEMRVSTITEIQWGKYVVKCKTERPARKLHDDKKHMSQVLLFAHGQGLTSRAVRLQIPDGKSDVGREITGEEITRLFSIEGPKLRFHARLRFQMEIALKTGMRLREMLHLQWDRIRWDEKTIRLRPEDTKTRKGRIVPLAPELFDQFRARFSTSKSPYVFPSRFDSNLPQDENKSVWCAIRKRARVKCRWHDFRHTCATRLLRAGVPTGVVQAYLGMTWAVLHGIYRHLNLDDLRAAATAMSESSRAQK